MPRFLERELQKREGAAKLARIVCENDEPAGEPHIRPSAVAATGSGCGACLASGRGAARALVPMR